jgi:hypothetical protein
MSKAPRNPVFWLGLLLWGLSWFIVVRVIQKMVQ